MESQEKQWVAIGETINLNKPRILFGLVGLILGLFIFLGRNELKMQAEWIPVKTLAIDRVTAYKYGSNGGFQINRSRSLSVYNSGDHPVVIRMSVRPDDQAIVITDESGKLFVLGKIDEALSEPRREICVVKPDAGDETTLKSWIRWIPYWHGISILGAGPLFWHFRFHELIVRKKTGDSMRVRWRYSTYKIDGSQWASDLYGTDGDGLIELRIRKGIR